MHVEPVISLNELKDAIEHKTNFICFGSMTEDFPSGKPEPPLHQSFFNCVFTEHQLIFLRQGHMFLAAILEHIMLQRHYLYLMTARIRSFNKLLKLPAILSVQKMNFPAQSRHQILYIKVADHRFAWSRSRTEYHSHLVRNHQIIQYFLRRGANLPAREPYPVKTVSFIKLLLI